MSHFLSIHRAIWAKTCRTNDYLWLPLHVHMADAAGMAEYLWDEWLSRGVKTTIATGLGNLSPPKARRLVVFLAAAHDIGKATPAFQRRSEPLMAKLQELGLQFRGGNHKPFIHPHGSQAILQQRGFDISLAIVAGGHHGKPPNSDTTDIKDLQNSFPELVGFNDPAWQDVQAELLHFCHELAGSTAQELQPLKAALPVQVLLSALVIMADWLASDESLFPLFDLNRYDPPHAQDRRENALGKMHFPAPWDTACPWVDETVFLRRFAGRLSAPRPLQLAVMETLRTVQCVGIIIIEAPMGEGKTEAALVAVEIGAEKTGRGGVFFALPTQATSDGIFPRLKEWVEQLERGNGAYGLQLVHGKAWLNKVFQGLPGARTPGRMRVGDDDEEGVVAHEWFSGRKKSMLAGFVVGTVDQLLLAALRQKHLALRHLGLADKVVIIDECHAYDAYMSQYLFKVLAWLGAYGVPVIILSATLTGEKRRELVQAYVGSAPAPISATPWNDPPPASAPEPAWTASLAYPLLTYSDGGEIRQVPLRASGASRPVALEALPEAALADRVAGIMRRGGCAGVIVNTVKRAQTLRRTLAELVGGERVLLLHSRFLAHDRLERELKLRRLLGPPGGSDARPESLVVVGTQVMEQSLDVDFDVLFTDLCPMDLLIQRIGRLHRHERPRPAGLEEARCFLLGVEDEDVFNSSRDVYEEWPLLAARRILREHATLTLPDDIADWVNRAYAPVEDGDDPRFREAYRDYEKRVEDQKDRAKKFQIFAPSPSDKRTGLTGWLTVTGGNDEDGGKRGEMQVRDADPSLEVIVVEDGGNGEFRLLPWVDGGAALPRDGLPDALAAKLAGCTVCLPRSLTAPSRVRGTITLLENDNRRRLPAAWHFSPWLRGELFLPLTREGEVWTVTLGGYRLAYDREYGLSTIREGGES